MNQNIFASERMPNSGFSEPKHQLSEFLDYDQEQIQSIGNFDQLLDKALVSTEKEN